MTSKRILSFGYLLISIILFISTTPIIIQDSSANIQKGSAHTYAIGRDELKQSFEPLSPVEYAAHPGFPISYSQWTEKASVTIADIDNDGKQEMLLPTYEGEILGWNASGETIPGFPIDAGWQLRGRLALADLDDDGSLEIVAGLESPTLGVGPRVSIYRSDGTIYPGWPQDTPCAQSNQVCGIAAISLVDLDKDSQFEVIAATNNRDLTTSDPARYVPNLFVWRSNGELAPGDWPNEDDHNTAIIGQIAVGDLDGDSYPDIVTGRDYNRLFAFNRLGGDLDGWPKYVWYPYDGNDWTHDQIEFPRSSPALADLDQDGDLEYIVPGHRREALNAIYFEPELLVYTADATRWTGWELPASGSSLVSDQTTRMIEAPAIGDMTGDGRPEIILATQDGYVRAYSADKQVLWEYDYAQGKEIHTSETVIGDVDGDGWNEVVFGTYDVHLGNVGPVGVYILDHTGLPEPGTPLLVSSPGISSSPALGDVDGDGLIEIAAATWNGWLHIWDTPGQSLPGRLPWPMARHDLQRTGKYIDPIPNFSQSGKYASNYTPSAGEVITYTIELIQTGTAISETIHITDTLPADISYIPGTMQATSGWVDDSQTPALHWTGSLFETNEVTITYSAVINAGAIGVIRNSALVGAPTTGQFSRSAVIYVDGHGLYLPLISD